MIRTDIRAARARNVQGEAEEMTSVSGRQRGAHAREMSRGKQKPGSDGFQIFIKPLSGPSIPMRVLSRDTFGHVKAKIYDMIGYNPDKIILTFESRQLEDGHTIGDYSIQKESNIWIPGRLLGSGKKTYGIVVFQDEKTGTAPPKAHEARPRVPDELYCQCV